MAKHYKPVCLVLIDSDAPPLEPPPSNLRASERVVGVGTAPLRHRYSDWRDPAHCEWSFPTQSRAAKTPVSDSIQAWQVSRSLATSSNPRTSAIKEMEISQPVLSNVAG